MIEKCHKYESLFIFGSEQDLEEHLKVCPDCQKQHQEMKQISSLVKEVAPFIKRKSKSNKLALKVAAGFIILSLSFLTINLYRPSNKNSEIASLVKKESIIAQMGFPTDEYGLLVVENY